MPFRIFRSEVAQGLLVAGNQLHRVGYILLEIILNRAIYKINFCSKIKIFRVSDFTFEQSLKSLQKS